MTAGMANLLGWALFLAGTAILIGACLWGVQIYNFNQFALLLLAVPAVMLLLLRSIYRWPSRQASPSRQPR